MTAVDDVLSRAAAVDEALHRARRAGEQREADVAHGRVAPDEPPPAEATVGPELEREACAVVLALCDAFRSGDETERAALRARVAGLGDVLRRLNAVPAYAARRVEHTGDELWLERGLAAAGLENRAVDERDTRLGLEALWRAADRAKLDARGVWHLSRPAGQPLGGSDRA
jgi:hypothetical protein